MGRPQKQTVDYFPHDTDAAEGRTLTILQSKYGNTGYAFWFKLLERLGRTSGHFIDCQSDQDLEYLAAKTNVGVSVTDNAISVTDILDTLSFLGSIDKILWEHRVVYSQHFVENIADVYGKRNSNLPPKPYFCNGNCPEHHFLVTETPILSPHNTQSKVNKSKVNNNIFLVWNSQKIIVHKKETDQIKTVISRALKNYSEEDICKAIENYAEIVKDDKYYLRHSWILKDFLNRGLEKFIDGDVARKNYLKDGKGGTDRQSAGKVRTDPDQYTDPADLLT